MKVDPIGLVDIPAAESVNHMTVLRVVSELVLLPVDHVFSQVHLVLVVSLVKCDSHVASRHEHRLAL